DFVNHPSLRIHPIPRRSRFRPIPRSRSTLNIRDPVEIGLIVVGNSLAWDCVWDFLSPFVGLGWGLDLVWCRLIAHNCKISNATMQTTCAVFDIFQHNHLSNNIASTAAGLIEMPAYDQYYNDSHIKKVTFGPLANDLTVYPSCTKN
ncbi:unnamed protein product, partial [Adineta steineri]